VVSKKRLDLFAIAFIFMLIAQVILIYAILPDYKSAGMTGGVGKGMTPDQFTIYAVRTENGNNLKIEVNAQSGSIIDVYFMTLDNLMNLESNHTFQYIPAASQMNVTSYSTSITLDASEEVYDLVIVGHTSNPPGTSIDVKTTQSHLPVQMQMVFQIEQFLLMPMTTFLFFLIVFALYENGQERNPYVKRTTKTKWNNIYMMSIYVTVTLFALQILGALFLYWLVVGLG
jgi:hypothetical protein